MLPHESPGFSFRIRPSFNGLVNLVSDKSAATAKELFSSPVPALPAGARNPSPRVLVGEVPLTNAFVFHHVALRDG